MYEINFLFSRKTIVIEGCDSCRHYNFSNFYPSNVKFFKHFADISYNKEKFPINLA